MWRARGRAWGGPSHGAPSRNLPRWVLGILNFPWSLDLKPFIDKDHTRNQQSRTLTIEKTYKALSWFFLKIS